MLYPFFVIRFYIYIFALLEVIFYPLRLKSCTC